jgi:hypothetical protein
MKRCFYNAKCANNGETKRKEGREKRKEGKEKKLGKEKKEKQERE